jgi:hypothetical protein
MEEADSTEKSLIYQATLSHTLDDLHTNSRENLKCNFFYIFHVRDKIVRVDKALLKIQRVIGFEMHNWMAATIEIPSLFLSLFLSYFLSTWVIL